MTTCYECELEVESINYRSRCQACQQKFLAAHTKIVIAGGRTFHDYSMLQRVCNDLLGHIGNLMVVSGTARGADSLGEGYAEFREAELLRMPANWEMYGKSAGYRRNEEMAHLADGAVIFWDGRSRGTQHMIDLCVRRNLPHHVQQYTS